MKPVEALTLIAGHVSEEILLRNEYLAAENEILRSKLGKRGRGPAILKGPCHTRKPLHCRKVVGLGVDLHARI